VSLANDCKVGLPSTTYVTLCELSASISEGIWAMPERKVVTFALDHISSDASAYR
jgi:hypothetical protein